jgi:Ethanolamine utilization protein EutJ (predicted chaperonin)
MCALFKKHEGNRMKVCTEFAQAVRDGLVEHRSNLNKVTKEQYALALWYDGVKKGWLR